MYSIYHLPQFVHSNGEIGKVGCTSYNDPQKRAIEQDYTFNDFEVLEHYEDIYIASNREIELQKQYGYPVDDLPYWQSVQNRRKWTKEDGRKGGATRALQLKDGVQATQVWANHTEEERKSRCNKISNSVKNSETAKQHRKALHSAQLIFTWEIAQEIRDMYSKGDCTQRSLAKQFNCSQYAICRILNNCTYTSPTWQP